MANDFEKTKKKNKTKIEFNYCNWSESNGLIELIFNFVT